MLVISKSLLTLSLSQPAIELYLQKEDTTSLLQLTKIAPPLIQPPPISSTQIQFWSIHFAKQQTISKSAVIFGEFGVVPWSIISVRTEFILWRSSRAASIDVKLCSELKIWSRSHLFGAWFQLHLHRVSPTTHGRAQSNAEGKVFFNSDKYLHLQFVTELIC